jgi:hypothetical protein
MSRIRSLLFRFRRCCFVTCSKTGRIVGLRGAKELPLYLTPLMGFLALAWFLMRVVPKPSRAAYPCQRVAAPLAGGFLVWLVGIGGAGLALRHARSRMRQAHYAAAGLALAVAFVGIGWAALSPRAPAQAAAVAYTPHTPNSPIGVAKGLKPGRVAWVHDPQITTWDGATTAAGQRWYDKISQTEANNMLQWALTGYADTTTPAAAWDAIFRNFNGGAAYQAGEKFFIKINLTTSNSDGCADSSYNWNLPPLSGCGGVSWTSIGESPQLMIALLDQLVNVVGVAQSNITIGDSTGLWVNELYNPVHTAFPNVKYMDARGTLNRTKASKSTVPLYWSAPSGETTGKSQDYLLQPVADAKYLIDLAVLKSHERNGITITAKNHFGSLSGGNGNERKPPTTGYYNLHLRLPLETDSNAWPNRALMAQYRPLVDLNGHAGMGGKTLLFLIDAIYTGKGWAGVSTASKWATLPFCITPACGASDKSFPSSLFLSMDQVAIDSVGFDFLSQKAADWPEVLAAEGVQDYLHEMALANGPPSGTFYDPEHDGTRMASQGVHEHWNNATQKKYTRNLGTGNGIELLYIPKRTQIRKTEQPIVVDGIVDEAWAGAAPESISNVVLGTVSGASDLTAGYRALYNDSDLYFLVDVTDDVVMRDSTTWYHDDTVEIMIDGDYSRGTSYDGSNDFELGYRWNDTTITRGANSAPVPAGAVFSIVSTASGYRLEAKIPLAQLGVSPTYGRFIGLDVHVCDDDDGGDRDAKAAWKATVDDSWQYPYRLGAGRLVGPQNTTLQGSVQGTNLLLTWTPYSWDTAYEVHRGSDPYFTPDASTLVQTITAPGSQYLAAPPAGGGAWYSLVRAKENGLGANSNRVGRFDFAFSP